MVLITLLSDLENNNNFFSVVEFLNIRNGKLTVSKLKSSRLSYILVETMSFVMDKS